MSQVITLKRLEKKNPPFFVKFLSTYHQHLWDIFRCKEIFWSLHNSFFYKLYNRHYLQLFRQTNPSRLAKVLENCNGNSEDNLNHAKESNPEIIGDVYIHPSANIHPSAVVSNLNSILLLYFF